MEMNTWKLIACTNANMHSLIGSEFLLKQKNGNDHLYGRALWEAKDFETSHIVNKEKTENTIKVFTRNSIYYFEKCGEYNRKEYC